MRKILLHFFIIAFLLSASQAEAGNVTVDPCCRCIVTCCGPVLVYRRPIVRNALAETRLALHYHLNYRYYRSPLFGPRVYYHGPIIIHTTPATPQKADAPTPAKPEYLDKPVGQEEPKLVPVQPSDAAPEPPQEPAPDADKPDGLELPKSASGEEPTTTTLLLQVPIDAQVTINGFRTTTAGTHRKYVSHHLDPQTTYLYEIDIKWVDGSISRHQQRIVRIMPGAVVTLNYLQSTSSQLVKK